ncbi:MAG: hypothetical protein SGCHY_003267 [Lobulomycetales sp.]
MLQAVFLLTLSLSSVFVNGTPIFRNWGKYRITNYQCLQTAVLGPGQTLESFVPNTTNRRRDLWYLRKINFVRDTGEPSEGDTICLDLQVLSSKGFNDAGEIVRRSDVPMEAESDEVDVNDSAMVPAS